LLLPNVQEKHGSSRVLANARDGAARHGEGA
jgi:hypothetical protein